MGPSDPDALAVAVIGVGGRHPDPLPLATVGDCPG
jgi:hypothetical protein